VTRDPLWFVVPAGIDDPARVSGGNVFDRRVREGLGRLGRPVRTLEVEPDAVADALSSVPDDELVLIDGLVANSSPTAVEAEAERLPICGLVHMSVTAFPRPDEREVDAEARALRALRRVIVPSRWLRDDLIGRGLTSAERVVVAEPGADDASLASGTDGGAALLCLGVVANHKGQDTLVDALAAVGADERWSCTIAGSTADAGFADAVADSAARAGVAERIRWAGVLDAPALEAEYGRTDLLVAPSRTESYGLAVGDALRRGIPVIASRVGGLPEAARPADARILVPPGDPQALATALRRWITDPGLRARMTDAAREAGPRRRRWDDTARVVDGVLEELR
jgi:glycosyltransferase involved in cell wall biosynthesis